MPRPRKDGRPPKPQLTIRDANGKIRKVKDTPENRDKHKDVIVTSRTAPVRVAPIENIPPKPRVDKAAPGITPGVAPPSGGVSPGRDAVTAKLAGAGGAQTPEQAQTQPDQAQVSYTSVVKIVNMILNVQAPEYAMEPGEQEQIGTSLDMVIAKHWPAMKNAGPEVALATATIGWLARVVVLPMLTTDRSKPTGGVDYPERASSSGDGDLVRESEVLDPFAN